MLELADGAGGPTEALGRVPQIAHDEAVFPTTLSSSGSTKVRRRRGSIVDSSKSGKDQFFVY